MNKTQKINELIKLTQLIDDLTSDNVDLKEQLHDCQSELVVVGIKDLKSKNKKLEDQIDILWDYISKNDIEDIERRFEIL